MPYGTIKVDNITFTNGGSDSTITVSGIVEAISGNITATGTIQGATIIGTSTVSGATVTGNTASFTSGTFVSGIFTTQISGATITGNTGNFTTFNAGTANLTSGVFASGTQGAPSLSIGTTTNGLYSPGADQVAISTGGSGKLFVNNAGEVDVSSANARLYITTTGANTAVATLRNASYYYNINLDGANGGLTFYNDTERLRITAAGLVGIGTSSPDRLLHVSAANTSYIRLENQDTTGSVDQYVGLIEFEGQDTGGSGVRAQIGGIYEGVSGATALVFGTSADAGSVNERLRINRNGNVGIGTTAPSALLSLYAGANSEYFRGGGNGATTRDLVISASTGANAGDTHTINASGATGQLIFSTASNERARIDSSGRLLVGTSTSTNNVDSGDLQAIVRTGASAGGLSVVNYSGGNSTNYPATFNLKRSRSTIDGAMSAFGAVSGGWKLGEILFSGTDGTTFSPAASIASWTDGSAWASGDTPGILTFSTTADGASSPTERMRITSGGALRFGQTTTDYPGSGNTTTGIALTAGGRSGFSQDGDFALLVNRNTSDGTIVQINRQGSGVGSISVTTTATAYNTSSDYRLKENVTAVTDGITRLQQLKPSRFNFIADPDKTVDGFLAHEVQTIVPEAIIGEKDAVDADGKPIYQGIDQSKLVPLLTAALQEAVARIETLEAKVAALESA
jgi:hypothetical protein